MLSTWFLTLFLLILSLNSARSFASRWAWASDSSLDLARVFATMSDLISASNLDRRNIYYLATRSASSSASTRDLLKALSLAARSAAISASTLDLLNET